MKYSVTKQKPGEHPLEEVFDMEPGTTLTEYKEVLPAEVKPAPSYDEKDNEIELKLEEIYNVAMSQVETIADEIERVEGKYKARMGEVTATMLNVALGAVNSKANIKMHKDKTVGTAAPAGPTNVTNNNLVVGDFNTILRAMQNQKKTQPA